MDPSQAPSKFRPCSWAISRIVVPTGAVTENLVPSGFMNVMVGIIWLPGWSDSALESVISIKIYQLQLI